MHHTNFSDADPAAMPEVHETMNPQFDASRFLSQKAEHVARTAATTTNLPPAKSAGYKIHPQEWLEKVPLDRNQDPVESTDMNEKTWTAQGPRCMKRRRTAEGLPWHPYIKFRVPVHEVQVTVTDERPQPNLKEPKVHWNAMFKGHNKDFSGIRMLADTAVPEGGPKKNFEEFCPPFGRDSKYKLCVKDLGPREKFDACYWLQPNRNTMHNTGSDNAMDNTGHNAMDNTGAEDLFSETPATPRPISILGAQVKLPKTFPAFF